MKKVLNKDDLLTEEVGLLIEKRLHLTPLAARIYTTLLLSSEEGLTFEDIIRVHQASKSSVSNNLKILVNLHYVAYYTKFGERKRYFRMSEFYVKTAMERHTELFEQELYIINKVTAYNKINNPKKFKKEESLVRIYQEYLAHLRDGYLKKIKEIEQYKNQL
ncbi:hypothetical protein ES677_08860 [Bizionia gelidisalsuginis]|uniref:Transcriptional regulator n=2 Tax=Bizionia TaxID=283785 RepID=A0A8H2LGC4_9FLAO|nr:MULTISPECIES: hypothetical protein [Bizionia]TYB78158.1 hypothetical protein ES676_02810 [Bizionia saleffrena]TYC12078.1 hypothetical protein ES677_08860 [Bizionia gelidisalsuginis]